MAQQVSTEVAHRTVTRVLAKYPNLRQRLTKGNARLDPEVLRSCGMPRRRAECCAAIASQACTLRTSINGREGNLKRLFVQLAELVHGRSPCFESRFLAISMFYLTAMLG